MAKESSPPGYELVESKKEIDHIYGVLKDSKLLVHCSTKETGRHVFETVAFEEPYLVVRPIDNRFVSFQNRDEVIVNFGIDQGLYFLKTDLRLQGKTEFAINLDQKIYKIQRRDNFRLTLPDDFLVEATFEKGFLPSAETKVRLVDLSVGGMGVLIPQKLSMGVEKNRRVDGTVYLPGREPMEVHCIIRHYRDSETHVRVGFEFEALAPEAEQLLGNIMMDLYRLMFSKYRDA